jgi:hypothetical protein
MKAEGHQQRFDPAPLGVPAEFQVAGKIGDSVDLLRG